MKKVLIVIDMQNDFIDGSLGTPEAQAIVPKVKDKIHQYQMNKDMIVFTLDTHYDNYLDTPEGKKLPIKHCIKNTNGWKISPDIDISDCLHFEKDTFGYLNWYLTEVSLADEIELVGLCTDICVISNALILKNYFPDIKIIVDADCCAGTTPEKHKAALETMKSCQVEVIHEN